CHVMERESFEDAATGAYLNKHFVSIKVDREERPDVDQVYMTFVQATSGGGGWPLNVFLTPDLKPFFGGTYFPPTPAPGRPAFRQLLEQIVNVWETRPDDVHRSADSLHGQLQAFAARAQNPDTRISGAWLDHAAAVMMSEHDPVHGGFGGAPKFPRPCQPAFLLRHFHRTSDPEALRMVAHTCERMAAGGMYDQLGGGFARYSVDERWLVPHFEKMLYDNAQLTGLYLDLWQITGRERFAEVARQTIRYVLRDMTHPAGGFHSAEDADSEGKEGKFYCWTFEELRHLLPPEELAVAARHFGVTAAGNFLDHSDPDPLPGQNVLSIVEPALTPAESNLLASAKARLFEARTRRVRPGLDDKVLTSWNGLMLGALARTHAVLGDESYRAAAERNLGFIQAHLWDAESRTLYHRWRDGARDNAQLLADHAFLLNGVLDLYEATLAPGHLPFAVTLADVMIERFHDEVGGGFWQSAKGTDDLILQLKDDYDGAEPSGNSMAAMGLLRLAAITGRVRFREVADDTLRLLATRMEHAPQAVPAALAALDFSLQEPLRVVIAGGSEDQRAGLLRAVHQSYHPNRVVLGTEGPVEEFARQLPADTDSSCAYVCTGNACQAPARNPEELNARLHGSDRVGSG
ncbi:MAG: thioredoxin domain-containing protein, partial [Verrucomicrobiae bacterium]|nr:thioredoxin domain-containing protein [Verrucomicrobiae bacterium]